MKHTSYELSGGEGFAGALNKSRIGVLMTDHYSIRFGY